MDVNRTAPVALEIAHILFIDIVGYSKLLTNEQRERLQDLNRVVRDTEPFRSAEAAGKLVRIPTGDGMVLAFFTSPDAPVRCAVAVSHALRGTSHLPLRMGIHSGPVELVEDVNDKPNLAGAGVNVAQRVMNCGDARHILLSARAADDLAQHAEWKTQLHEIGEAKVKHGVRVRVVSLYNDEVGNPALPQMLQRQRVVRRRRLFVATAALMLLIAGAALGVWTWQRNTKLRAQAASEAAAKAAKSVAVLPFENLSTDEQHAVFAGGVHREVLSNLAKVADLKVISRTSVMRYKPGAGRNLKQIADELGVSYVVEGTVQREGNRVHVAVELIDARTDTQTWAQTYDGDAADVLTFQSEIAERITNQLGAKLSPRENNELASRPTQDIAAYETYIRARALMETPELEDEHDRFVEANTRAVQLLEQSVARDPQFAAAYWALVEANIQLSRSADAAKPEYRDRAEAALKEAQRLAPEAGETILGEARIIYYGYQDFKKALATLERAANYLPNNADVCLTRALLYRRFGRWQEAYTQFVRAAELNPQDMSGYLIGTTVALELRWWAECDQMRERLVKHFPRRAQQARFERAISLRLRGDVAAGNRELESLNLNVQSGFVPLFYIAMWKHNYTEARSLVNEAAKYPELEQERWQKEVQLVFVTKEPASIEAAGQAERRLEEQLQHSLNREEEGDLTATLSAVKMILGKKSEAVRLVEESVEKYPVREDAMAGGLLRSLAYTYVYAGDREHAIQTFAKIVQVPGELFYGPMKYDPVLDGLRKDPRFQAIVEQSKQPFPR